MNRNRKPTLLSGIYGCGSLACGSFVALTLLFLLMTATRDHSRKQPTTSYTMLGVHPVYSTRQDTNGNLSDEDRAAVDALYGIAMKEGDYYASLRDETSYSGCHSIDASTGSSEFTYDVPSYVSRNTPGRRNSTIVLHRNARGVLVCLERGANGRSSVTCESIARWLDGPNVMQRLMTSPTIHGIMIQAYLDGDKAIMDAIEKAIDSDDTIMVVDVAHKRIAYVYPYCGYVEDW